MSVNKVILVGHLGRDPEIKKANMVIANFTLATSERYKDKDTGEFKHNTEWHKITVFGKQAEFVENYLKKGSHVYIEGRLKTEKYVDKNNVERTSTKIIATQVQLLDSKEKRANESPEDTLNDDIPF